MGETAQFEACKQVVLRVMADTDDLPSLPTITLKIRRAISDPKTTTKQLANIIRNDPSFTAILMKASSSPVYKTQTPPKTIEEVISLMGLTTVDHLIMAHSIRSMFVVRNPSLEKLYRNRWKLEIAKAGLVSFLARRLNYKKVDEAIMACLLTEIGSLAILTAISTEPEIPDSKVYLRLCRVYSKEFGAILLRKWGIEGDLISTLKKCGDWEYTDRQGVELTQLDIINLALYHAMIWAQKKNLPPLQTAACYKKILPPLNEIDESMGLALVNKHRNLINEIIRSML